jgi:hypothetical protein
MLFDEATANKICDLLMPLVDNEHGMGVLQKGLGFTVTPEFLEAMMQADSFCSGFVLSSIVPREQAEEVYNENLRLSLEKADDEHNSTYGPNTPAHIVMAQIKERHKDKYPNMKWGDED